MYTRTDSFLTDTIYITYRTRVASCLRSPSAWNGCCWWVRCLATLRRDAAYPPPFHFAAARNANRRPLTPARTCWFGPHRPFSPVSVIPGSPTPFAHTQRFVPRSRRFCAFSAFTRLVDAFQHARFLAHLHHRSLEDFLSAFLRGGRPVVPAYGRDYRPLPAACDWCLAVCSFSPCPVPFPFPPPLHMPHTHTGKERKRKTA